MMNAISAVSVVQSRLIFLTIIIGALAGCQVRYEDKSEMAPYNSIVGKRLEVSVPVIAYGINESLNPAGPVDYIELRSEIIAGPEIVFSKSLSIGTLIRIDRVLAAEVFSRTLLRYEVSVLDGRFDSDTVVIPTSENYRNGTLGLDSAVYSEVESNL
jgi:hypothetical protein